MRGSVSGVIWGLVLGSTGLGLASLVSEQPVGNGPPAVPLAASPQIALVDAAPGVLTPAPLDDVRAPSVTVPQVAAPVVETAPVAPDTSPSTLPQTANIGTTLGAPLDVTQPDILAGLEQPVVPPVPSQPLATPTQENQVVITTQPAVPAPAVVLEQPNIAADLQIIAPQAPAIETPQEPPIFVVETVPTPDAPATPVAIPEVETDQPDVAVLSAPAAAPVITPAPSNPVEDIASDTGANAPAVVVETVPENVPEVTPVQTAPAETPAIATPALPQVNNGVQINRPGATDTATVDQPPAAEADDALPDDAPALLRFAAAFENPANVPSISFILIDDGNVADGAGTLAALPFPATVILNPLAEQATATMQAYRDAGIEVGMQISLPRGATPVDLEVAFEAGFDKIPEAVILFSDGSGILQNNRAVTAQAMQVLAADGRGFVAVQRGLGNVVRVATQAGVPAGAIRRDLDGAGEDAARIRRTLDQAALRARQDGSALLLARLTAQTLAVLSAWAVEVDNDQIVVAPVSAVLKAQ